jgi:hypothetical protein
MTGASAAVRAIAARKEREAGVLSLQDLHARESGRRKAGTGG